MPTDLTHIVDRECIPSCPVCECLIMEYEASETAYIYDRKCLVHKKCVNWKEECKKASDGEHCWHTVCVDLNNSRRGKEQCCWCGYARLFDRSESPAQEHGKYIPFRMSN